MLGVPGMLVLMIFLVGFRVRATSLLNISCREETIVDFWTDECLVLHTALNISLFSGIMFCPLVHLLRITSSLSAKRQMKADDDSGSSEEEDFTGQFVDISMFGRDIADLTVEDLIAVIHKNRLPSDKLRELEENVGRVKNDLTYDKYYDLLSAFRDEHRDQARIIIENCGVKMKHEEGIIGYALPKTEEMKKQEEKDRLIASGKIPAIMMSSASPVGAPAKAAAVDAKSKGAGKASKGKPKKGTKDGGTPRKTEGKKGKGK